MKKKLLRNVGLVALSTILVGSTAVAFTACDPTGGPGSSDYSISVNIFCSNADTATNKAICDNWAKEYSETHADELGGNQITVDFQPNPDQNDYFEQLGYQISAGNYADIIYLSPKNVIAYATAGHVLDMSGYVEADAALVSQLQSIWSKSLAFYATTGSAFGRKNVTDIEYNGTNFIDTATGGKASIYGLPKDYSNFALGVNLNYFTDEMKAAYTTLKENESRKVQSQLLNQSEWVTDKESGAVVHTGASEGAITYAYTGTYTNPYTGEEVKAVKGEEAPFIAIGVPVTYKPFNFYKYETYEKALAGGDPMATSVLTYTGDKGYTIVMPGFPGETFAITEDIEGYENAVNEEAAYDADTGHVVLTWTEYSALNWACAYMLNSYAWSEAKDGFISVKSTDDNYAAWKDGNGGAWTTSGYQNVYGGEQYEQGSFGVNGYVNPWAYSNDASFIDQTNSKSLNEKRGDTVIASKDGGAWAWTSATNESDIMSYIGNATEDQEKTNLDGTTRMAKNQYGINSENFVEAYAAFHEYFATWNAQVGQTGDVVNSGSDKAFNGQATFVAGSSLFYGVGTWDVSEYQEVNTKTLNVGIVPTAVSNRLSLYVETRDAFYTDDGMKAYSTEMTKQTGDAVNNEYNQRSNVADGIRIYDESEILANQLLRQDKWGGRMDSVGYAVNSHVADEAEWKASACVSLVLALTVNESAQVTLTYGGAQIPNVVSQCNDYLNYNVEGYEEGAFKDMITPEGDAQGNDVWDEYYALAVEMAKSGYVDKNTQTVAEYLAGKKIASTGEDVKYDPQYADVRLCDFTTATTSKTMIAYSMRVLHMINYSREQRDVSIRMQYMNSARQQSLYTPGEGWITVINATGSASNFLAYRNQASLSPSDTSDDLTDLTAVVAHNIAEQKEAARTIYTPALYLVNTALTSQTNLDNQT